MDGPIHPSQSVYHCRIVSFLRDRNSLCRSSGRGMWCLDAGVQPPAIAGIFDQGFFPGTILATSVAILCGSCSPAEPSSM